MGPVGRPRRTTAGTRKLLPRLLGRNIILFGTAVCRGREVVEDGHRHLGRCVALFKEPLHDR